MNPVYASRYRNPQSEHQLSQLNPDNSVRTVYTLLLCNAGQSFNHASLGFLSLKVAM